ncbi:MAG: hypothetical protein IJ179_10045 [Oscillospiraceae bacterium]|nr:hypothetical protein [Oscillospiraceae bacterium]
MSFAVNYAILAKGWERFTVMHKDRKVAAIREDGTCTIYAPSFMPYNLYLEEADDLDARLDNLNSFYYWCSSRVLPPDRKYAKEILNSIGARHTATDRDRAAIAISFHGLSLTDVYWIKFNRESVSFADLTLFRHSLSGAFADVSLNGRSLTVQNAEPLRPNDAAGDIGTQGVAPKAWIRENKIFYLLKSGDERDVKAELLASKIARCFRAESVAYESSTFEDKPVSRSRIITSEDESLVSMEAVDVYCVNHELDRDAFVLKKDAYAYHMMNLIDYLVGNTDRHWGNWGFLVSNDTNRLEKLYPTMDFNKSFLAYDTLEGALCQTNAKKQSQREAAIEAVRAVGLNQIGEVKPAWFEDQATRDMFFRRLEAVTNADAAGVL